MRYKALSIPDGYVLTIFEVVFLVTILMFVFGGALYHFYRVVEIPPTPRKVVLESAFVYRGVSEVSRTTSNLYFRIGSDDKAYDYVMEASSRDIKYLAFSKSKKLWVALESDRNKQFVWGVYDDELVLLISRKNILQWARYKNSVNYFMFFAWGFGSLYLLFVLINNGVWNRFLAKRIAHENREN
ncbi:hypothetical protein EJA72_13115 [Pseudomonas sp. PB120]|uniref:hypothetical protein n=1 Tax=Pseudomonas sp. PB120 TaxID=2494700 RepID=UPI0012FE387D|nr:hypothetical protein [Pseudomonas sp. PB120]MVV49169.1 hypothetical protein [Pseudomonas sp. PB120]